jgi:glycosyltransferase involved in cell wall biosynthesis
MSDLPLVSVSVPTFNCEEMVVDCLESIKAQTYPNIEVIIVDSFSTDRTPEVAARYGTVYSFGRDPSQKNIFAVPYQRNHGVEKSKGELAYIVDSDMRLAPRVVEEGVRLVMEQGADAVIVPEISYGEGFWANCRALEKSCYNAMPRSRTDAARFVRKAVWDKLGGLDATLGGGDDWDWQLRLDQNGYKTLKMKESVRHYEGRLTLKRQLRKKFVYGRHAAEYFRKHSSDKGDLVKQYSFLRSDFVQNFGLLARDPVHAVGMVAMKTLEYSAAGWGMVHAKLFPEEVRIKA